MPVTFLPFFSFQIIFSKKRGCKDKNIYFTTANFLKYLLLLIPLFPLLHSSPEKSLSLCNE